jgi:tetratricopeptide (TPR) repeat protein
LASYHQQVKNKQKLTRTELVDLLDELVTMALPNAALQLADEYPDVKHAQDFRAQLALGIAAMLAGDHQFAEAQFRHAQELIPEEPAPYVNLVQMFMNQDRMDEAELWCLAGLDAEPNHFALWDLLALLLREKHGEYMPDTLLGLAEKRCSWAGLSLAANLTTTGDRYLKAGVLEKLYHQGERDPQFLIELTGAYGIAGDFNKIPPVIWQAESLNTKGLPWQLHVHAAQALLSLNQPEDAMRHLEKGLIAEGLPDEARAALAELKDETKTLLDTPPAAPLN